MKYFNFKIFIDEGPHAQFEYVCCVVRLSTRNRLLHPPVLPKNQFQFGTVSLKQCLNMESEWTFKCCVWKSRFIIEKCDGVLIVENKKKKVMIEELKRMGYDSDPVKAWKIRQNKDEALVSTHQLLYCLLDRMAEGLKNINIVFITLITGCGEWFS